MDDEKCAASLKTSTKRHLDDGEKQKISFNLRSQSSSSSKQPAQDRLKRLQANLKYSHNKKQDKERHSPQKKTRRTSSNTSSSHASQEQQHNHFQRTPPRQSRNFPESPKYYRSPDKTRTAQYLEPVSASTSRHRSSSSRTAQYLESVTASSSSSSGRLRSSSGAHYKQPPVSSNFAEVKNAWAKPKALLDASNRLEAGSRAVSANTRLALLRESLQQQQQQKATGSSGWNNDNNNNESPWSSRKLLPAERSVKATGEDVEPMDMDMDIDWQERNDANRATSSKNDSQAESMEEDLSDITLLRLLSTGQDLPARREDYMYFVLDTNVLLDNLVFVEELTHLALHNTNGSMLYIPYVVIRELDSLKDRRKDNELKRPAAVRAIRYLNNKFDTSLSIQAQSAKEEVEHLIDVECADDSIVNCCLQLQSQVPHLMLLTNDSVLRIKAKSSYIEVSCRSDLMRDFRELFDALPS